MYKTFAGIFFRLALLLTWVSGYSQNFLPDTSKVYYYQSCRDNRLLPLSIDSVSMDSGRSVYYTNRLFRSAGETGITTQQQAIEAPHYLGIQFESYHDTLIAINHEGEKLKILTKAKPGQSWEAFRRNDTSLVMTCQSYLPELVLGAPDSVKTFSLMSMSDDSGTIHSIYNTMLVKIGKNAGFIRVFAIDELFRFDERFNIVHDSILYDIATYPGLEYGFEMELVAIEDKNQDNRNLDWDKIYSFDSGAVFLDLEETLDGERFTFTERKILQVLKNTPKEKMYIQQTRIQKFRTEDGIKILDEDTTNPQDTVAYYHRAHLDVLPGGAIDMLPRGLQYLQVVQTSDSSQCNGYPWECKLMYDKFLYDWYEAYPTMGYYGPVPYAGESKSVYAKGKGRIDTAFFSFFRKRLIYYKNGSEEWGKYINLGVYEKKQGQLVIYPNPVEGRLKIDLSAEVKEINILDVNGRVLKTFFCTPEADLSTLSPGIYIVRVVDSENTLYTGKVVKK